MNELNCISFLENTNFLLSVLEASSDGVLISDDQGNVLYVNSAYESVTGLTKEQMIGKNLRKLREEKLFNFAVSLLVLEQKKPASIIHEYVTGKKALTTANPIYDEDEKTIVGVICNTRDISGLINLRNELEATKTLLQKYSNELKQLRRQHLQQYEDFIYKSKAIEDMLQLASKAAQFDSSVLIQGESGVGKEMLAKFIHQQSPRAKGPYIRVNCAAIPAELFESELFGYEQGSFTGASQNGKPGMFELANGGTILLDEIGELPLTVQSKLLRVLQEKEVFRLGAQKATKLNVRVLAATNKNLALEVKKGNFREDLFFRLNVVPITIPPLRERSEDIPELIRYFLEKLNKRYKKNLFISLEAMEIMADYSWPGNVRELENLIEYLFIINTGDEIGMEDLPAKLVADHVLSEHNLPEAEQTGKLNYLLERFEKDILLSALKIHPSIRKAAAALGINPSTLSRKLKKHNIDQQGKSLKSEGSAGKNKLEVS
jgi:PAS domain S-box-containing protein